MKVCFVGLGSIGTRHLRNFKFIMAEENKTVEIHALRESTRELAQDVKELIDKEIHKAEELDKEYDIVFITNPTHLHYSTLNLFKDKAKHVFMEKPVFDKSSYDLEGFKERMNQGVYYVAAPLRYKSVIQELKEIIKGEEVYSARVICSSYLPDWRPNVDYRTVYSAFKEQGGGVSIDCIHELDYIINLFGYPEKTFNIRGKYSNLEINSDDLSIYVLKYADKVIELHLDYFGRERKREIEIFTAERTITGDLVKNEIRFSKGDNLIFTEEANDMYIREIKYFLSMIDKAIKNDNDIIHANEVLRLAEGE